MARTYVYNVGGELVAEYTNSTASSNLNCAVCYPATDNLGSTRLITAGSTGQVVKRIDFLPFGEIIPATVNGRTTALGYESTEDPTAPTMRFTGKERDSETYLDYFGARYFSGAQGRFTSPDWSAAPAPVPFASLTDPQTLNLYAYVRNNPLLKADLDGHGDLSSWLADQIKRTARTPPPPSGPAPKPPALITPGTPQNKLAQIEEDARANPAFSPQGTPGSSDRRTFCNIATTTQVDQAGGPTDALRGAGGAPNQANTDFVTLAQEGSGYHRGTPYEAQDYTNSTGIPALAVQSAAGHGHIVPLAPELVPGTQKLFGQAPLVNNIGARMQLDTADKAFSRSSPVVYYIPDQH